jgi:4-oxalocrotonate tautomerase family enzyme
MPLVKIETIKGKSPEYKKSLFDTVHNALVKSLGIEEWDRFQRIIEYDKDNFEIPEGKTDDFMIIELTLFPGRSKKQKQAVIETISSDLNSKLGIAVTDIFIVINNPPMENWGLSGKQLGGVEQSGNSEELLNNLEKIHTTELGMERIRKNLNLSETDVIEWCKKQIVSQDAKISRQGKNWYIEIDGNVITINAKSYTIITAHKNR